MSSTNATRQGRCSCLDIKNIEMADGDNGLRIAYSLDLPGERLEHEIPRRANGHGRFQERRLLPDRFQRHCGRAALHAADFTTLFQLGDL